MNKHRVILGWLFFAIAALISVVVVFASKNYFGNADTAQAGLIIRIALVVVAFYALAGLSLLVNSRYSKWLCLPFSVLMLFSFPVGTLIGGYYLWYFWKIQSISRVACDQKQKGARKTA